MTQFYFKTTKSLKFFAFVNSHCKAAADLLPPLPKSATSGDEVLLIEDLVNDFILSYIIRNVSLIFFVAILLSLRLLFLIFLSSTRRPLPMYAL